MRALRILALVLIGAGLFVQGTAYAAARPAAPIQASSHCAEMTMTDPSPPEQDQKGCCDKMDLGCLVSMNCIAPLFAPAGPAHDSAAQSSDMIYSITAIAALGAFVPGPEPPPPQPRS